MASDEPIFSLDWAPDAIIVVALDGSVLHINPRAEDLFGYRNDELTDKPVELLIPEGVSGAALESMPLQHVSRPVICAHRDGTRFAGTARWRPAPPGSGDYLVFSIRDLEGEERSLDAGGVSGARVSRPVGLLSLFAHDVRESLHAIQLLCDALRPRAAVEAAAVSEIVASVGRLLERLTRVEESSAIAPEVEPCRLGELLGTLGRELMPLAERKGLRLIVTETEDVIGTDPVLFREMLHNLLANAIRYTDAGHVEIRCEARTDDVRVEIIDTGVGMPRDRLVALLAGAEERDRLGVEGSAADPSAEDTLTLDLRAASLVDGGGESADAAAQRAPASEEVADASRPARGLGLAISHQLAQLLGCSIDVDSAPGSGSRFTVVAPRELDTERWRREQSGT